jgi:hypothetical protein
MLALQDWIRRWSLVVVDAVARVWVMYIPNPMRRRKSMILDDSDIEMEPLESPVRVLVLLVEGRIAREWARLAT